MCNIPDRSRWRVEIQTVIGAFPTPYLFITQARLYFRSPLCSYRVIKGHTTCRGAGKGSSQALAALTGAFPGPPCGSTSLLLLLLLQVLLLLQDHCRGDTCPGTFAGAPNIRSRYQPPSSQVAESIYLLLIIRQIATGGENSCNI